MVEGERQAGSGMVMLVLRDATGSDGFPSSVGDIGDDQVRGDQGVRPGEQSGCLRRTGFLDEPLQGDAGINDGDRRSSRLSRTRSSAGR